MTGKAATRTSLEFFLMYLERQLCRFGWAIPKSVTVSFENVMCAVLKAQTMGCLSCHTVSRWHRAEQVLWLKRGFGSYVFISVNYFHDLFHRDDYIINNISFSWPEISEVAPETHLLNLCGTLHISHPASSPVPMAWLCSLSLSKHTSFPPTLFLSLPSVPSLHFCCARESNPEPCICWATSLAL